MQEIYQRDNYSSKSRNKYYDFMKFGIFLDSNDDKNKLNVKLNFCQYIGEEPALTTFSKYVIDAKIKFCTTLYRLGEYGIMYLRHERSSC